MVELSNSYSKFQTKLLLLVMDPERKNVCDDKLFRELFKTHARDLHNFLYYKYGKDNNPKDLVQEAFLKLWNNCQKVLPEKARSFLFTVANNQMLNDISRKKTALTYEKEQHIGHTSENPEFVLREKEYSQRLQAAIEDLSEEQRTAFLLNRIEGKKHKEIAEMLGISTKGVEKRIYTALEKLREKLGDL